MTQKQDILKKYHHIPFKPLPFLSSAYLQSLCAVFTPHFLDKRPTQEVYLPLVDGDTLTFKRYQPKNWKGNQPIVVLVHGLTGSSDSSYNIRLTSLLNRKGFHVVRVNQRGCGSSNGLTKRFYHSGKTEDLRSIINWCHVQHPLAPISVVGFSIGGNVTLKMAGEAVRVPNLHSVIAVSAPLDLFSCSKKLQHPNNRIMDRIFARELVKLVQNQIDHYHLQNLPKFPHNLSVFEFDQLYSAPINGFKDALDYYTQCSSKNFINNIKVPTLVFNSKDDTIIDYHHYLDIENSNVEVVLTEHGGHLGFVGRSGKFACFRWMDVLIARWLCQHHGVEW